MTFEEGRLFVLLKVILCFLASDFSYPVFFFFFQRSSLMHILVTTVMLEE